MAVNSHIQIPKCILKHFCDDSQRAYYLDLKSGYVGMAGVKKLGTEYGYYSDDHEKYLSKEIEAPLAALAAKVRQLLDNDGLTIKLTTAEETLLKKYVTSSMARSTLALETMQNMLGVHSRLLLSEQQKHDFISRFGTTQNNSAYKTFEKHYLVILVNRTSVNWVVPRNCFYAVSSSELECIVAPIAPQCALCLFPPEYAEKRAESMLYRLGIVNDPYFATMMNIRALLYEYLMNQTFVASASKAELEILRDYLVENRQKLDNQRLEVREK